MRRTRRTLRQHGRDTDAAATVPADRLQPHLSEQVVAAISRYRRGGRRARVLRRTLALALLVVAAVLALTPQRATEPGVPVSVVTRDIAVGEILQAQDLRTIRVLHPPDGVVTSGDIADRSAAGPLRRGEIVTDVRLLVDAIPPPGPGRVALPVRPDDAALVGLLRPGMRVAIISLVDGDQPVAVTDDAIVLWLPEADSGNLRSPHTENLTILAVPAGVADDVTSASLTGIVTLRFP